MTTQFINLGSISNTRTLGNDDYVITGTDGNNTLTLGNGDELLTLGNGNNTLTIGGGPAVIKAGSGNNTITTKGLGANTITLTDGNNTVTVGHGNDVIVAGNGLNTITAGDGNDTIILGNGFDQVTTGNGNSKITVGNGVGDTIFVGTGRNTIVLGTGAGDIVHTGSGNNTVFVSAAAVGADTIQGALTSGNGSGNALVLTTAGIVDPAGVTGFEIYQLANGKANSLTLQNANFARLPGGSITVLGGNAGNTVNASALSAANAVDITGGAVTDTLSGGAGNDSLNGRGGADAMKGGAGDDTYFVDNTGDVVTEAASSGVDTVYATLAAYTLGANVENLRYSGTGDFAGTGNTLNNTIVGGGGKDALDGGAGNDILDGRLGADVMKGGIGNDLYRVDNTGDVVTEAVGAGTDTVYTTLAAYTLSANVENLRFTGTGAFAANGNALNNTILGGAGNDTLNGRGGADSMRGGAGDDRYYVDNAGDTVLELAGMGTDIVYSSRPSFILPSNVENLTLMSGATSGTGNSLANIIRSATSGDTSLKGLSGNDLLVGSTGDDTLDGGAGADKLTGGAGADIFVIAALADSTVAVGGRDTITDFSALAGDKIDLHLLDAMTGVVGNQAFTFIGTSAFSGAAGEVNYSAAGSNTLVSGNVNGDHTADFSIMLSGSHALGASNFVL